MLYIYYICIRVCVCVSMVSIFPRTFDGDLLWGCDQTCSWHIIRASYRKATELICYREKMAKLGNLGVYDVCVCVYRSIYIHEKFKVATVVSPSLSLSVAEAVHTLVCWALQAQGLLIHHVDKRHELVLGTCCFLTRPLKLFPRCRNTLHKISSNALKRNHMSLLFVRAPALLHKPLFSSWLVYFYTC